MKNMSGRNTQLLTSSEDVFRRPTLRSTDECTKLALIRTTPLVRKSGTGYGNDFGGPSGGFFLVVSVTALPSLLLLP